jgi:tRNA (mo5U34)-methyltransferase
LSSRKKELHGAFKMQEGTSAIAKANQLIQDGDMNDVENAVAKIKWWHRIDLGNGIVTPGVDDSSRKLKKLALPGNLSGMSVLDVGAWDGFFSFEAERRGASRVLATDSYCWGKGGGTKDGFELARKVLRSKVEDKEIDVMDLSPQTVGVFDIVLFLGVLYHMRHPLLALERVSSVTRKLLIVETHVDMVWTGRPVMVFYPRSELNGDPTNWWGPNPACVEAMLTTVGFRDVRKVSQYHLALRMAAAAGHRKATKNTPLLWTFQQNRMTFHASR